MSLSTTASLRTGENIGIPALATSATTALEDAAMSLVIHLMK
jgi:hypothetical protein